MLDLRFPKEVEAAKPLLIKHGFKKKAGEKEEATNEKDAWHARLATPYETDYPQPLARYSLVYQTYSMSMEESYFWVLNHLRVDLGFPLVKKVKDIFSASRLMSHVNC